MVENVNVDDRLRCDWEVVDHQSLLGSMLLCLIVPVSQVFQLFPTVLALGDQHIDMELGNLFPCETEDQFHLIRLHNMPFFSVLSFQPRTKSENSIGKKRPLIKLESKLYARSGRRG